MMIAACSQSCEYMEQNPGGNKESTKSKNLKLLRCVGDWASPAKQAWALRGAAAPALQLAKALHLYVASLLSIYSTQLQE